MDYYLSLDRSAANRINKLEVFCVIISQTRVKGETRDKMFRLVLLALKELVYMNGLDLSSILQTSPTCLGMSLNCRRSSLYEF